MVNDALILLLIVCGFWLLCWLGMLVAKVSWMPIIPFVPLLLLGIGYALNKTYGWAGTTAIAAIHLVLVVVIITRFLRRPHTKDAGEGR